MMVWLIALFEAKWEHRDLFLFNLVIINNTTRIVEVNYIAPGSQRIFIEKEDNSKAFLQ